MLKNMLLFLYSGAENCLKPWKFVGAEFSSYIRVGYDIDKNFGWIFDRLFIKENKRKKNLIIFG